MERNDTTSKLSTKSQLKFGKMNSQNLLENSNLNSQLMATTTLLGIGWGYARVTLGMVVGGGSLRELNLFHLFLHQEVELTLYGSSS